MVKGTYRNLEEGLHLSDQNVLKMAQTVGKQLNRSITLSTSLDLDKAAKVIRRDDRINAQQVAIENLCAVLLVKYGPVASDLKHILGTLYVVGNLERIGDYAVHIAKNISYIQRAKKVDPGATKKILALFKATLEHGLGMMEKGVEAFYTRNLNLAETVIKLDQRINDLGDEIFEVTMKTIEVHVDHARDFQILMFLARSMERLGDHAAQIARRTIYILTGDPRSL